MDLKFSEYSEVASKIVDELPDTLSHLDAWIEKVEQSGSEKSTAFVHSAETLRVGLSQALSSVERERLAIGVEQQEVSAETLVKSLEHAASSLDTLANSLEGVPAIDGVSQVDSLEHVSKFAELYAASIEQENSI